VQAKPLDTMLQHNKITNYLAKARKNCTLRVKVSGPLRVLRPRRLEERDVGMVMEIHGPGPLTYCTTRADANVEHDKCPTKVPGIFGESSKTSSPVQQASTVRQDPEEEGQARP